MLDQLRRFHASFHDSEIILWARLQFVFLLVYQGLQSVDVSAFISDHRLFQCYLFTNAIVTEMLRRNREDWKDKQ
jgi:hypothetical protein